MKHTLRTHVATFRRITPGQLICIADGTQKVTDRPHYAISLFQKGSGPEVPSNRVRWKLTGDTPRCHAHRHLGSIYLLLSGRTRCALGSSERCEYWAWSRRHTQARYTEALSLRSNQQMRLETTAFERARQRVKTVCQTSRTTWLVLIMFRKHEYSMASADAARQRRV